MDIEKFLNEVRLKTDLNDLITPYTNLKHSGRISKGLCPFHKEKTPSFTVYQDTQSFYCFGCGAGGDIITFVMLSQNLDYMDALKYLADKTGVKMPDSNIDSKILKLRSRIFEINRISARFFHNALYSDSGVEALKYLRSRKLSDKVIRHFGLGFAPLRANLLTKHLKEKGFSDYELEQANVVYKHRGELKDRFFNRIIFPIIDIRGNVIAFGARAMGQVNPKYLNTSDTQVFKKSDNLFSMNFAKNSKEKYMILAEGYMDVIAFHKIGFFNAVASLGTSLTTAQAKLISRYAGEVIIAYDSDDAGQKATMRAIPILRKEGVDVKILKLPSGKDPDEFINSTQNAAIKIKNIIKTIKNDVEFRLDKLKSEYDLTSINGKVRFINKACELFAELPSGIERDIHINKLSSDENIDKNVLKDYVKKILRKRIKTNENQKSIESIGIKSENSPRMLKNDKISVLEENIIAYIMKHPEDVGNSIKELYGNFAEYMMNKDIFAFIVKKTDEKGVCTFSDFSSKFSAEVMGFMSKVLATRGFNIKNKQQLQEYVELLVCEYKKLKLKNTDNIPVDQLEDFVNILKKHKQ